MRPLKQPSNNETCAPARCVPQKRSQKKPYFLALFCFCVFLIASAPSFITAQDAIPPALPPVVSALETTVTLIDGSGNSSNPQNVPAGDIGSTSASATSLNPEEGSADVVLIEEQAIKNAVAFIAPSVAKIETVGGTGRNTAQSSAICVSETGLFLTAAYNLRDEPSSVFLKVTSRPQKPAASADGDTSADGATTAAGAANASGTETAVETRRFIASIVATDHSRNLVLLRTEPQNDFPFYPVVTADIARAKVGQTVIAVGKVYDQQRPNISVGIISAFGRIWNRALQTDAKISRANYGGPLINLSGEAIGILCPLAPDDNDVEAGAAWYDSGIGFAVPLSDYQRMIDRMKTGEDLHRGLLGVTMKGKDMFANDAIVGYCHPKSPAEIAGLKSDDHLIAIDGQPVKSHAEMKHALGPLLAGDQTVLTIKRGDQTLEMTATLAEKIEPYTELAIGVVPAPSSENGVLEIEHVLAAGPAAKEEIDDGDAILSVDGVPCDDWEAFESRLVQFDDGDQVDLQLASRNNESPQNNKATKTVSLVLAPLTSTPPVDLKDVVTPVGAGAAQVVEISTAESSNRCYAIVPENDFAVIGLPALFVWVSEPGVSDSAETLKALASECQRNNLVVLVPQSLDDKTWTPDEKDFILKAIQRLAKKVPFDTQRVAIGGEKTAGTMACITAFSQRDTFQGLIMFDALFPRRLPEVQTAPEKRLLMYFAASQDFKAADKLDLIEKALAIKKFPIHRNRDKVKRLIELMPEVASWIRTLNRK